MQSSPVLRLGGQHGGSMLLHGPAPVERISASRSLIRAAPCSDGPAARHAATRPSAVTTSGQRSSDAAPPPPADSRRRALLLAAATLAAVTTTAASGPLLQPARADQNNPLVQYWLGRQRGNFRKLLAPIQGSQQRLRAAQALMDAAPSEPQAADVTAVLQLVRLSSMNCYAYEADEAELEARASMLSQTLRITDPCTFRIIVRTITDLSTVEVKARGVALMGEMESGYQQLDVFLQRAQEGKAGAFGEAKAQLGVIMDVVARIELFVREVLLVPAGEGR